MNATQRVSTEGSGWRWALPALLFVAPLLLWPAGTILVQGLAPDGRLSVDVARAVAGDAYYWERLAFSLGQAAASTTLALVVGLPAAWVFALVRFPGRSLLRALVTVPFVLPTIVVALAFERLLGPGGWAGRAAEAMGLAMPGVSGTIWAILLAHVFYNVSVVIRIVGGVWANLDPATLEAAQMLGAGRIRRFTAVTLPALLPAVLSASALVFMFCFTAFGTVLLLGGGDPHLDTLEVVVYRLTTRLVDLPEASVVAIAQVLTTVLVLLVYAQLQRRVARPLGQRARHARRLRDLGWGQRLLVLLVLALLTAFVVVPLGALVHGALTVGNEGRLTTEHFARLFEDSGNTSYVAPASALRWSLTFALGSTAIALLVGLAAGMAVARSRGVLGVLYDGAFMLPLAIPAVTLGFGYLVTFNRAPVDLRGSAVLVLLAHALIGYPFVMRAVLGPVRALDPELVEAARMLGASRRRAWLRVTLPLVARGLFVGAAFAFGISLGEFGATLLLQRQEFATVPVAIYEALGRPGDANLGAALAMATVLMGVSAAAFFVIERVRYREVGEF
ncbi:MAG: iron ABC transporter permease [Dehalococcoidia bacterium]